MKDGGQLRREREDSGISLRHLAKRIGISAAYLSDLELGRRTMREAIAQRIDTAIQTERANERAE